MKRFLCALLLAATPLADALADVAKAANARVTLVYQHEMPNVPGVSANASETKPAKLLAVLVVDTEAKKLVLPLQH